MSPRRIAFFFASVCALVSAGCSVNFAGNPTQRCANDDECPSHECHRGFCVGPGTDAQIVDGGRDAGPDHDAYVDPDARVDAHVEVDANVDAAMPISCDTDTNCGANDEPCDGVERCTDGFCEVPRPSGDGTLCDTDSDDTTRELCVAHVCQPTQCGDGVTDTMRGEDCDDGNDVLGDGCDDCRFSCTSPTTCGNGNECDGEEDCDLTTHRCVTGVAPAPGADCRGGRGTCMLEVCVPDSCTTAADCNDGDECNGVETCGPGSVCVAGTAMDCGDGNSCTEDMCTRGLGCSHVLMDDDGDGFAPESCAGAGGDCRDMDASVYPGAPEICGDMIDNNCSGDTTDERDFWYADCDGDGYAAMGAQVGHSCDGPPPTAPAICVDGGWTAREPTSDALTRDCNDGNALVHPGQTTYQTVAIPGAPAATDFDYDCDGTEERRSTSAGVCSGTLSLCTFTQGWQTGIAACGVEAQWISACSGLGCTRGTEPRIQGCL